MTTGKKNESLAFAASALAGLGVCLAITWVTGKKEAWDASAYYSVGIPVMCAFIFVLGYLFPIKPWRWTLSMAVGQSAAVALAGNSFSLWPLSLLAMAVLSIPQLIAGMVASKIATNNETRQS